MSPGLQLILGCLMLSATMTYAWWSKTRVLLLQFDLGCIGDDFRAVMTDRGWDDDEQCRDFLESLDGVIEAAPSISPAVIGPIARLSDGDLSGFLGPEAEPFFRLFLDQRPRPAELLGAMWRVNFRLARYLVCETFSGWLSILRAIILGIDDVTIMGRGRAQESRDSMEVRAFAVLLSRGRYRRTA